MAKIRKCGYELRCMWDCEFDMLKLSEILKYVNNHPLMKNVTLNPRDAFYGGRTENIAAYYKVQRNEKIKYTDIRSLYPYTCKRDQFPVGHPKIYVSDESRELTGGHLNNLVRIEGLVKCSVLRPRNLYLPLLPIKMNDRLMFVLCRSPIFRDLGSK